MTRDFAVLKAEVLIRIYCNKPTAETIAMSAEICYQRYQHRT